VVTRCLDDCSKIGTGVHRTGVHIYAWHLRWQFGGPSNLKKHWHGGVPSAVTGATDLGDHDVAWSGLQPSNKLCQYMECTASKLARERVASKMSAVTRRRPIGATQDVY
jgi:hypothetical protein